MSLTARLLTLTSLVLFVSACEGMGPGNGYSQNDDQSFGTEPSDPNQSGSADIP